MSEQVNRKCPPGNMTLQLSTIYTAPDPSSSTSWTIDVGAMWRIN